MRLRDHGSESACNRQPDGWTLDGCLELVIVSHVGGNPKSLQTEAERTRPSVLQRTPVVEGGLPLVRPPPSEPLRALARELGRQMARHELVRHRGCGVFELGGILALLSAIMIAVGLLAGAR